MSQQLKRVLIMAGGTGGHVFPGLAVATYLRELGVEVHWLGTEQGLESRVVKEAGFPLHTIRISGLRGKGIKTLLLAPFKICTALWRSGQLLRRLQPNVVLGMGGFVSGPGGIASYLLRYPLIIHEQNAKAGFTNQLLAPFAKRVLAGFPQAFRAASSKVEMIGNPVRSPLNFLPPPEQRLQRAASPLHLLVLGGSLGAKALNDILPRTLAQFDPKLRPLVLHQTGEKHLDATKQAYAKAGVNADLQAFIADMPSAYAWADMVICRAGALTVAELCAVGLGAIFVPFPYAAGDHQTVNADFMVKNHAALSIQEAALTENKLAIVLQEFIQFPEKRLQMAKAAYQLRNKQVTEKIFAILSTFAKPSI